MRLHEVVTELSGWKQIATDRAKLSRAQAKHQERTAAAAADMARRTKKYQREFEAAVLEGLEPPQPPQPPPGGDNGDAARLLMTRHQELVEAERQLLARNATSLERQLAVRHDELLAEAQPAVAKLEAIADEMRSLTASVAAVRQAAGDRRAVPDTAITAASVADAVTSGRGLLRPAPTAPTVEFSAPYAAEVDADDVALFTPGQPRQAWASGRDARLDGRR